MERARAGDGQLVMIVGEPGMGKSRLIEEFHARARRAARELSVCGKWASQRWSAKPFSAIFAVDISDPLHPAAA
jgi:predicted ATPase